MSTTRPTDWLTIDDLARGAITTGAVIDQCAAGEIEPHAVLCRVSEHLATARASLDTILDALGRAYPGRGCITTAMHELDVAQWALRCLRVPTAELWDGERRKAQKIEGA